MESDDHEPNDVPGSRWNESSRCFPAAVGRPAVGRAGRARPARDRGRGSRGGARMFELFRQREQQLPPAVVHGVPFALRPERRRLSRRRRCGPLRRPVAVLPARLRRADARARVRAGLRAVGCRSGPVLRRGRRHDDDARFGPGRRRARHLQLNPSAPHRSALPVTRRSRRPSVGKAAQRVPAPDSSGSSRAGPAPRRRGAMRPRGHRAGRRKARGTRGRRSISDG